MPSVNINVWAIIVAALVNMVVGSIWYSKSAFAKSWSKASGKSLDVMMAAGNKGYAASALGAIVMAVVLRYVVDWAGVTSAGLGAWVGFLIWLGFVATSMAPNIIFSGQPMKLWHINAGYYLVVLVINGALLAVWT